MMRAAEVMGLKGFTLYQLRHQFVSTLLAAGVPITTMADRLGHRDSNVTFRICSHLLPDAWEQGREALRGSLTDARHKGPQFSGLRPLPRVLPGARRREAIIFVT